VSDNDTKVTSQAALQNIRKGRAAKMALWHLYLYLPGSSLRLTMYRRNIERICLWTEHVLTSFCCHLFFCAVLSCCSHLHVALQNVFFNRVSRTCQVAAILEIVAFYRDVKLCARLLFGRRHHTLWPDFCTHALSWCTERLRTGASCRKNRVLFVARHYRKALRNLLNWLPQ